MTSREQQRISSLAELFAATGNSGIEDLRSEIEDGWGIDSGMDLVDITSTRNTLRLTALWRDGDELHYPFTLEEFWSAVKELGKRAARRQAVRWLPDEGLDAPPRQIVHYLADFLEVDDFQLVDAIGGGWMALTQKEDLPLKDLDTAWYAAGEPIQILLGLTPDIALVAEPVVVPTGLAGPERLETGMVVEVPLYQLNTVAQLSEAVSAVEDASAGRHGICHGCRTFQEVSGWTGRHGRYCRGCLGTYLGVIID